MSAETLAKPDPVVNAEEDDEDILPADMFEEPAGFRPPSPPPTSEEFIREPEHIGEGTLIYSLEVRLVGRHSLWAHKLWNAGLSMTKYLDKHKDLYVGKRVLELGAAASLPSLICAVNGAKKVVITDYPDPELINNMHHNAAQNAPDALADGVVQIVGFQWGTPIDDLLTALGGPTEKFDLILLADLIFNHTEHQNLLKSCREALAPGGLVITTFTQYVSPFLIFGAPPDNVSLTPQYSHVVKWSDRDDKFFEYAVEEPYKFQVEKIYEERWSAMFPNDTGDEDVRSTVHAFKLW
ncbi:nicotinamide n-methyltransferase [Rhizophlyctis rosea]|uniref:Nicotinamide n-methyltransferase n=1 Tax=Rhizophlyctis rosea TaxID=64517 RepID=A0AAD5X6R7_9FUNG|nr:nicotinamide n-methyltransferase [Rhizophlyctis rosea]